jgi:bacterioferritin-associated ferredoxin
MTIDDAKKLKPQDIMERLGGLPARKVHCSVLGDKALRAAINDWYRRSGQIDKIEIEQGRVIDKVLKITDHDIEEAVLDGADTLEKVQAKTKVGTGDPNCIPEVEQLIRFYKEKYFGA